MLGWERFAEFVEVVGRGEVGVGVREQHFRVCVGFADVFNGGDAGATRNDAYESWR